MAHVSTPWTATVWNWSERVIKGIAAAAVLALMIVTMASVVLRWIGKPMMGANEIIQYTMVILVATGLCITQMYRAHISVDLVVERLPRTPKRVLEVVTNCLIGIVGLVIAWIFLSQNLFTDTSGMTATGLLDIPVLPFKMALALGFVGWGGIALVQIFGLAQSVDAEEY